MAGAQDARGRADDGVGRAAPGQHLAAAGQIVKAGLHTEGEHEAADAVVQHAGDDRGRVLSPVTLQLTHAPGHGVGEQVLSTPGGVEDGEGCLTKGLATRRSCQLERTAPLGQRPSCRASQGSR